MGVAQSEIRGPGQCEVAGKMVDRQGIVLCVSGGGMLEALENALCTRENGGKGENNML